MHSTSKAEYYHQLATLVEAGVPLSQGLQGLAQQETGKFRIFSQQVALALDTGIPFSQAAQQASPPLFSPSEIELIAAGEMSGTLNKMLRQLATISEARKKILSDIAVRLIYPLVLLHLAAILPGMIALVNEGPIVALINVAVILVPFYVLIFFISIYQGFRDRISIIKTIGDSVLFHTPGVNWLFKNLALTLFTRSLRALMRAGLPIEETLRIAGEAGGNVILQQKALTCANLIQSGVSLSEGTQQAGIYPPVWQNMLTTAEISGKLDDTLETISRGSEDTAQRAATVIAIIVPAVVYGLAALLVVIQIIRMLWPIYALYYELGVFG